MPIAFALSLILALAPPASAGKYVTPQMDAQITAAIDSIYRMDFDATEEAGRKVVELNPEHPYGYFALAVASWARYIYETEQTDQGLIPTFESRMQLVIDKGLSWTKKHPDDADALMALGASYGITGRLSVDRRQWIKAYMNARRSLKYLRAAVKADPQFYDAYLGLGMYDYYTDLYPRFIRVLTRIVLRGNRQRGIEILRMVAEKGRYSKYAAKMILVEIYTEDSFGAHDPEGALRIMNEVRIRYPHSQMLHSAQLVSLYEGRRYEEVVRGARRFLELAASGKYRPIDRAKGGVILGTALWALNREEEALEYFRTAAGVTLGSQLSRWAVWALIRAGQLEDLLGHRDLALKDYHEAARQPDYWGLGKLAKKYLIQPYKVNGNPGPIQPP